MSRPGDFVLGREVGSNSHGAGVSGPLGVSEAARQGWGPRELAVSDGPRHNGFGRVHRKPAWSRPSAKTDYDDILDEVGVHCSVQAL